MLEQAGGDLRDWEYEVDDAGLHRHAESVVISVGLDGDRQPAVLSDGALADRDTAVCALKGDRDRLSALIPGESDEELVDPRRGVSRRKRSGTECAAFDDEGRVSDNQDVIGLYRFSVARLLHGHPRLAAERLHECALVFTAELLNDQKGEPAHGGKAAHELFECRGDLPRSDRYDGDRLPRRLRHGARPRTLARRRALPSPVMPKGRRRSRSGWNRVVGQPGTGV